MNERSNERVYLYSANWAESSEVLPAEKMTFESLLRMSP